MEYISLIIRLQQNTFKVNVILIYSESKRTLSKRNTSIPHKNPKSKNAIKIHQRNKNVCVGD